MNHGYAVLCYGYLITGYDFPSVGDTPEEEEKYKEWRWKLRQSGYFYDVNGFDGDKDFFGVFLQTTWNGDIQPLITQVRYEKDLEKKFKEFFPNCNRQPGLYLMCKLI